jgi:hypothetical protein
VHGLFTRPVAAPWALKFLKIRSLGRAFSSVSDLARKFAMNPRETTGARKARVEMVMTRWAVGQHQSFVVPGPLFSSAAGAGFHRQTTSVVLDSRLVGRPYPRRWPRRVRSHESQIHARTAGEEGEKATKG